LSLGAAFRRKVRRHGLLRRRAVYSSHAFSTPYRFIARHRPRRLRSAHNRRRRESAPRPRPGPRPRPRAGAPIWLTDDGLSRRTTPSRAPSEDKRHARTACTEAGVATCSAECRFDSTGLVTSRQRRRQRTGHAAAVRSGRYLAPAAGRLQDDGRADSQGAFPHQSLSERASPPVVRSFNSSYTPPALSAACSALIIAACRISPLHSAFAFPWRCSSRALASPHSPSSMRSVPSARSRR
jgi:hypothetical protein